MQRLNLPEYTFKIKSIGDRTQIFDEIRKKYVSLTPEEWVRQHIIRFLIDKKGFPRSLIAMEMGMKLNKQQKRTDAVVYGKDGQPLMIVECKSPQVKLTQDVFDQIARYNLTLKVKHLLVTNGIIHYYCTIDREIRSFRFEDQIPDYANL